MVDQVPFESKLLIEPFGLPRRVGGGERGGAFLPEDLHLAVQRAPLVLVEVGEHRAFQAIHVFCLRGFRQCSVRGGVD